VSKYPDNNSITLWSDSCVSQNKNSIMTFAMTNSIKNHSQINEIILKFSTPDHGCVQEIDNIHSFIEKTLNNSEYFSSKNVERLIENSNRKNAYKVIEMQSENFFDFQSCAKLFNYKSIPFSKAFQIRLTRNFFEVEYRLNPSSDFITANIRHYERSFRNVNSNKRNEFPNPRLSKKKNIITEEKKKDINSMISWAPEADKEFLQKFCA
jgi:hypothetical protein